MKQWGHPCITVKDGVVWSSSHLSIVTVSHLLLGCPPQEDGKGVSYIHQCAPYAQHTAWHKASVQHKYGGWVSESKIHGSSLVCPASQRQQDVGESTALRVWRPRVLCIHSFIRHSFMWHALWWEPGVIKIQAYFLVRERNEGQTRNIVDLTKGCPGEEVTYYLGPGDPSPGRWPWSPL